MKLKSFSTLNVAHDLCSNPDLMLPSFLVKIEHEIDADRGFSWTRFSSGRSSKPSSDVQQSSGCLGSQVSNSCVYIVCSIVVCTLFVVQLSIHYVWRHITWRRCEMWRYGGEGVGTKLVKTFLPPKTMGTTRKVWKNRDACVCVCTKFRLLQPRTKTEGSGVRFHVLLVAGDWGRRAEHQAPRPRVAPSAPQSSADCRQPDARRAPTHVISARSCASPDVTPSGHGPRAATQKPERG